MRKIYFIFALALLFVTTSVFAADLTGKWDLQFDGPMGPETWDLTVKMTGENTFSAKGTHDYLGDYDGKGTLKGKAIEITFVLQDGQYTRIFTGTLEGNKATGKDTLDGQPESDFTMVKK